jgi:catechol 2,3-dioxygenase-like lactoylglutathione lyase family enzyme
VGSRQGEPRTQTLQAPRPSDEPTRGRSPAWSAVRVAHAVRDLPTSTSFYRDVLGLPVVGGFTGHDGYDGVFLALPGGGELELTRGPGLPGAGGEDDLLVLYLRTWREVAVIRRRLADAGVRRIASANPYWNRWGRMFLDPDGHRIVVAVLSLEGAE